MERETRRKLLGCLWQRAMLLTVARHMLCTCIQHTLLLHTAHTRSCFWWCSVLLLENWEPNKAPSAKIIWLGGPRHSSPWKEGGSQGRWAEGRHKSLSASDIPCRCMAKLTALQPNIAMHAFPSPQFAQKHMMRTGPRAESGKQWQQLWPSLQRGNEDSFPFYHFCHVCFSSPALFYYYGWNWLP